MATIARPPPSDRDLLVVRMLTVDWLMHLGRQAGLTWNQYGSDATSFSVGAPDELIVTANFVSAPPYLQFSASDPERQSFVDQLVVKAREHVRRGNFGGLAWHTAHCEIPPYQISTRSAGMFVERLSLQTRIVGWRRLARDVLLEFTEELDSEEQEKRLLFAPKGRLTMHIGVPAPCVGQLSGHVAAVHAELGAAIGTFSLGRPVRLPFRAFPTRPEVLTEVTAKQADPSVHFLARKGIALDIPNFAGQPGGLDAFGRLRAAVLSFDAAVQQEHDSVACILYVVAAECLATPRTLWQESRPTKRFVQFFEDLLADELDEIVKHPQFESTFGFGGGGRTSRKLRRNLLSEIYAYRSGQLHTGLSPEYHGFPGDFGAADRTRRAFFAEFAEGAILRYLTSPRSSLVGHPNFSVASGGADA